MFKLLPGLSYVGSSHNNHTGKNAKFQSKEVQGGQSFNMRIIENNEQFMPHCILHLSNPGTAPTKQKKSFPGVLPVTGLQKTPGNKQNQLPNQNPWIGQGNNRNEDMTFAQHLAQALLLSRQDYEIAEKLRLKKQQELDSAIEESRKNQNQSFEINNAKTEPIITVTVIGQDSNGINFRVKMSMNMGKLKKSYAERFGVPVSSLKFLFNGHHISDDESPKGGLISESFSLLHKFFKKCAKSLS